MKKKISFIGFIGGIVLGAMFVCLMSADAVEPVQRRGAVATSTGVSSRTPVASTASTVPARASAVSSRAATTAPAVRARTATPAVQPQNVSARAGALQKVVQTGTGINAAATNTVVDATCRERYFGCMDSFCMMENDNGGRCLCSDRKSELDEILTQIEALDQQSYQLATAGVERIDMGANADYVFGVANQIEADTATTSGASQRQQNRLNINLDIFSQTDFGLDTNFFDQMSSTDIANKTGESLRTTVNTLCVQQMSGCEKDLQMLQMMYAQNISSDCRAYENELTKRKNSSAQKLSTAQAALRAAALESFETSNKWDLGQCTIQMKQCVQNNGCGEDFTGCVNLAAAANASGARSGRMSRIKGPNTYIEIAASSLDALESKKTLCFDTVTASCIAVRDQVWDAFLADAAPAVKSAELTAESNIRMSCISNISDCFQKGCRDTMDPNDPEGSYDLCLSRPEAIEHICKVQIDQCSVTDAKDTIMSFVKARLAAMRVDACTAQAKACFTADTACGKNFENCINLGLDVVKTMCPVEKLTACNVTQISQIDNLIQGLYLAMDNVALEQCQKYAAEKMIEVCGDTASCEAFEEDTSIGTESLASYKNNNGDYVIEGLMSYAGVTTTTPPQTGNSNTAVTLSSKIDVDAYLNSITDGASSARTRIRSALNSVNNTISNKIAILENDTRISFCVNGRSTRQIMGRETSNNDRFPHLLDNYKRAIFDSGITAASVNYSKKYNELYAAAFAGQSEEINRAACMAMASNMNVPTCKKWIADDAGEAVCTDYAVSETNLFNTSTSGMDSHGTSITIPGLKISEIVELSENGKSDFVQTGTSGEMIASIQMSAVYAEGTSSCTITMTTTGCKGGEAVYDEDYDTRRTFGFGTFGFGWLGLSVKKTSVLKERSFAGTVCTEFLEPTTTQTVIQM